MLTPNSNMISIDLSLPHEVIGTATPELTGQKRPLLSVVFLCPSKIISTGLIRIESFMVGCIGHLSRWLVPVASCCNLVQSATQRLQPKSGGYIPNTGETAMRNHTQKPTNSVSQKSIFFLIDSNRKTIASGLSYSQAYTMAKQTKATIKFLRMEVLA